MSSTETYRNFQMNIHVEAYHNFNQASETNFFVWINQCKSLNFLQLMVEAKLHII